MQLGSKIRPKKKNEVMGIGGWNTIDKSGIIFQTLSAREGKSIKIVKAKKGWINP